jgi:hypothetical protein
MKTVCFPKRWHLPKSLHGVKIQKVIIIIITAVKSQSSHFCTFLICDNFLKNVFRFLKRSGLILPVYLGTGELNDKQPTNKEIT